MGGPYGDIEFRDWQGGFRTPYGVTLPPTSRIAAFVRSTGVQDHEDWISKSKVSFVQTLAAGINAARSNYGDIVCVLPGHSESVTDATMLDNLKDGTTILGLGDPMQSNAPTFRWTATGSSWAVDNANVTIANLRLRCEGASGVAKAIDVTGAGFKLVGNNIQTASGATNKAAIVCEIGAAATECQILSNLVRGTATHNSTNGFLIDGATSDVVIARNRMIFSATAANGLINITAAALNVGIYDNYLYNTMTSSEHCIVVGNVAANGLIIGNRLATLEGAAVAPALTGFSLGGASLFKLFDNEALGVANVSGDIAPARDT